MNNIRLISASAGSGKTYRLMNEIAERITGHNGAASVAPEEIMVTTFTNKAAAELKERIRMKLLEAGRTEDAQRIYDSLIGTVNGVCARLLKEYAFEAGLSPSVEVMPEEDAGRIFNMATASAIDASSSDLEPIARRLGMTGYGSGFGRQDDWRDVVHQIVNLARANDMDAAALQSSAKQSWQSLENILGQAHSDAMGEREDRRLQQAIKSAIGMIEQGERINKPARECIHDIHQKLKKGWELNWADWITIESINIGVNGSPRIKQLWSPWDDNDEGLSPHLKHPRFRSDLRKMIFGTFDCAANAMQMYADYKSEQGLMDFVDQESLVLNMARNNASFRDAIRERVKLLMVDEFQDTSPIQLALFLEFSRLARDAIWVGDQKQAIYGFRGTDPLLMDAVAAEIERCNPATASDVLGESWRSRRRLVDFCNGIFTPVFHHMAREKVQLRIPRQREVAAQDGWVESWNVSGRNQGVRAAAFVSGLRQMMSERKIRAGDVAVLCRNNDECFRLSEALHRSGIRASVAQGDLLATPECSLTLAALRYMTDQRDTVAMAEIVCYSNRHRSHDDWLPSLMADPEKARASWQNDPIMERLAAAGTDSIRLTPMESLETAMNAVGVEPTIHAWGNVAQRMSNLDQLRAACERYQGQCKSRRSSATVTGFLTWIYEEEELRQAEGSGEDTVQLLTYHRSKGLEWPVVVLSSLNKGSRHGVFGVSVNAAPSFDVNAPLSGRSIHFWPWPYGTKKKASALTNRIEGSDIAEQAKLSARAESQRLLYVGMTRARDGLILVRDNGRQQWLDELVDKNGAPVLYFDEDNRMTLTSGGWDDVPVSAKVRSLSEPHQEASDTELYDTVRCLPPQIEDSARPNYPPATVSPSTLTSTKGTDDSIVSCCATLGEPLPVAETPRSWADFGNAIHGFFAADVPRAPKEQRLAMASVMLSQWDVASSIRPENLLEAHDRLHRFIARQYPEARILREWPMTMVLPNYQRMNGWIDVLLELPDGYVVIDHKSYPGEDARQHASVYVDQLAAYQQAVEWATGRIVKQKLIHMPMAGVMLAIRD